jgi:hypothetical protein
MSVADLYTLGGSAGVIALMVAVAALLGFRTRLRIESEADARRFIGEADPDARVADLALGADGLAALARLEDGRLVALRALGDRVSVRVFASSAARLKWRGAALVARFGDLGYPTLHLKLAERSDWLARLAEEAGAQGAP